MELLTDIELKRIWEDETLTKGTPFFGYELRGLRAIESACVAKVVTLLRDKANKRRGDLWTRHEHYVLDELADELEGAQT